MTGSRAVKVIRLDEEPAVLSLKSSEEDLMGFDRRLRYSQPDS